MDRTSDRAHSPRPSTASVQVRELSWQGLHNPCPQSKDPDSHGGGHSKLLVEQYLSPTRLQALAQVDDLRLVSMLEMCVDTRDHSLGNFGVHLPNLGQLKLNDSRLGSVRDLGTALGRLQVLWLARCGLSDLDGIGSLPALKELYVSYNNVSDLSPLCLLGELEVLDLEGNSVEDLGQVRYLQLCPKLATLTLEGNLVCLRPSPSSKVPPGYNYRVEVRKLIPHLQVLDEVPAAHTGLPASWKLDKDWLMVKEAIKEGSVLDGLPPRPDHPHGDPSWRFGPKLSLSLLAPKGPSPEGLLPKDPAPEDDASNLTHGAGQVLCGNPTRGLRERQHRCQARLPPENLPPPGLEGLAIRASTSQPDPADSHDLLALAGLWTRKELRGRHLGSWQERAAASWGPQRGPEEQEDKTGPKSFPGSPSLAPGPPRTSGYNLLPSPPKVPMQPDSSSCSQGPKVLQFRGRRLRALGSSGPGPGKALAAMAALRTREVTAGPSPRAQGCPGLKPAPDPAARAPALWCLPHLNPITPAQSHP
ncbi:leucine-rich repeat-containing protein 56 isoform X1 [Saccopteryx bilineata]|uniref:leucine-rich repeat-containing protein 56 isoform X1 n=2 Tax=Saccopteryx bilineata TaxID=59482 RepID=UPI00338E17DD